MARTVNLLAAFCPAVVRSAYRRGKMRLPVLMGVVLGALPVLAQNAPPKTSLKVGDMAPDFTIAGRMNTTGKDIKLSDFRGKKIVILAFFPAAFTGG